MTTSRTHTHSAPTVTSHGLRLVVDARSAQLGLTRDRLAKAAGVGRSTLFDWLAGTAQPSAAGWAGLAAALELGVCELLQHAGVRQVDEAERARLERGWTRGQLAQRAGVSFATVKALEDGELVRPDAVARVAATLGLDADFVAAKSRVTADAATPLGQALQAERLVRGWTIAGLARHLGAARQLVSAWLLGAEPVADRWTGQLAEFLHLTPAQVADLAAQSRPVREGSTLAADRRASGLSRAELAHAVGVSSSTVEQWESGRRAPDSALTHQLQAALTT